MVSYKNLYLELKRQIAKANEAEYTDYLCPLCNSKVLGNQSEFFCSNVNCKFDKIVSDLWYYYAENNNLERVDEIQEFQSKDIINNIVNNMAEKHKKSFNEVD